MPRCAHPVPDRPTPRAKDHCEECVKEGTRAVALRLCLTCGHVGCCDSSSGMHARRHHEETGHLMIQPLAGPSWTWCYVDDAYVR